MNLTTNFPIQVTTNRNLIQSEEELLDFINQYNTKLTLYYSIYQCELKNNNDTCCSIEQNKYHFCNTQVDKIVFDIDNLNSMEIIRKFHAYCLINNLKHLILFSGCRGFHIYIFTKNYSNLKNPKQALLNSHNFFVKELNLKVNGNGGGDADNHIFGDVSRMMRFPNTLHLDSKLYCVPLITNDLVLGKTRIMKKAREQNLHFTYYGDDFFDISKFDNNVYVHPPTLYFEDKDKVEISIDKQKLLDELPPCLQSILVQPYIYWRNRFFILKYLQHNSYSDIEIDFIMKTFLEGKKNPTKGHDNYQHYLKERQYSYVKNNKSLFSCDKVKKEGLCIMKSDLCNEIIKSPVYL